MLCGGLGHLVKDFLFAIHIFDVFNQLVLQRLIGFLIDTPDEVEENADDVIRHFHLPEVKQDCHQSISNMRRVTFHLISPFREGPVTQQL